MKKTNRLIDFFAVIGPDNQFTINDLELEKGINSLFTLLKLHFRKKHHKFGNNKWIF